jgi:hypothetical protein
MPLDDTGFPALLHQFHEEYPHFFAADGLLDQLAAGAFLFWLREAGHIDHATWHDWHQRVSVAPAGTRWAFGATGPMAQS